MIDPRRRQRQLDEQRRRSIRIVLWLSLMALLVMFASIYFFWMETA